MRWQIYWCLRCEVPLLGLDELLEHCATGRHTAFVKVAVLSEPILMGNGVEEPTEQVS